MLPPASIAEIANLGDPVFRLTMMRDCVCAVQAPGHLFYPLLNIISTFIDGLASGAKGNTKAAYLAYLEKHFPDLCAAIGAEKFYISYRCAAVHEFGLKPGFAIGRGFGLGGKYLETQNVPESGDVVTVLNIDRLVNDFLSHVEHLLVEARVGKAP
jgi:hypothetical protein